MTAATTIDWLQRFFELHGVSKQLFQAQALTDNDERRWEVQFDDIEVIFDTTRDGHEMWWTACLGRPRPAEAQAVFHAMLMANVDRNLVSHAILALDPTDGGGLLISHLDSLDCSDEDLTQRLEEFINTAAIWKRIIEGTVASSSASVTEQTENTVPLDAIRV